MTSHFTPGDLVDVTIKGVQFAHERAADHEPCLISIRADDGRRYTMPAQAAIKRADLNDPIDAATLQQRVNKTLDAIDHAVDEQALDPWTGYWLRRNLDPNPRHWPPQAGDVWDDGMPFGGSLWFAREYPAKPDDPDQTPKIGMVSVVASSREGLTPHGLLESSDTLKLVYRPKDGSQ